MRRPALFVLLAAVAALLAAVMVYSALKKREAALQEATAQSVSIVVATRDLTIGSKLDSSSVKLMRWSRDSIPPGAFTDSTQLMDKFIKTGFAENEPIVASRLFGGEKNAGVLPLLIPVGMRAITIPVDEVADIAGFVLPNAHVDVIISAATGDKNLTKIVMQNLLVLAIAQDIQVTGDKAEVVHVVTLLATPEEAERLVVASREGSLHFALRNYEDTKIVMTSGASVQQLLHSYGGAVAMPPLVTQPAVSAQPGAQQGMAGPPVSRGPKPVEVEILRDGKSSEKVSFVRTGGKGRNSAPEYVPPGPSSAAESPDKIAGATTDDRRDGYADGAASGSAADAAAPAVATAHDLGVVDSPPRPSVIPGTASVDAPNSKTIEIP